MLRVIPMESILQEVNDFNKEFEELKNSNKELLDLSGLLKEDLRLARNAEKNAESKRAKCQAFLIGQQEVIQNLLAVKEENEDLKLKLIQTEKTLSMIQNNSIEQQMRKDAQMQELEQEYLKKIIKVQEDADLQVEKEKSNYLDTINEMKITISKLEDEREEKDAIIVSLQEEIQDLKEWADANKEAFHKKLTEQERKHQSELETWRMAELNRTGLEQVQRQNLMYRTTHNFQAQYKPVEALMPIQGYQADVRFQEQIAGYRKPLVTHYKNSFQGQNTNMVRPLSTSGNYQSANEFISANEVYMQSHKSCNITEEVVENSAEKMKENNKPILARKQKTLVPNKKRKLFSSNQNMI